jgi:hypothetical protein
VRLLALLLSALALTGCAALIDRASSQFANDLENAIRAYNEPSTVAEGIPAYLLLLEARLQSRPDDVTLRLATARLTATYAGLFVDNSDAEAGRRLHARALMHARHANCVRAERLCQLESLHLEELEIRLAQLSPGDLEAAYTLATTWTGWVAANADDFNALADLPRVEALLDWVARQAPEHDDGAVWLYLAVLNSQRPPAAGGQPRKAREYFNLALKYSAGHNLLIKVLMADSYARLMFDRELYVELLESTLAADIGPAEYHLVNQIARERAQKMLQQTEAIFD